MGPTTIGGAVVASWWGYADADSALVGILVGAVAVLSVSYIALRVTKQRRAAAAANAKKTSRR